MTEAVGATFTRRSASDSHNQARARLEKALLTLPLIDSEIRSILLGELLWRFARVLHPASEEPGLLLHARFKPGQAPPSEESAEALGDFAARTLEGASGTLERRLAAAHALGQVYDLLMALEARGKRSGDDSARRRKLGSYFTPPAVARSLVGEALAHVPGGTRPVVCDPAVGGGAFLLEALVVLSERPMGQLEVSDWAQQELELRALTERALAIDISAEAIATTEGALWLLSGVVPKSEQLIVGNATLPEVQEALGTREIDWVVGNPPWVAYQGRAAQRLAPEQRARLRREFSAFSGYPTLHGVFVELAARLAPRGLVSLLLPSSLSDLSGYGPARRTLRLTHSPLQGLQEYGQDAFEGVVQPCFGLIATPRESPLEVAASSDEPFTLRERARASAAAFVTTEPEVLGSLRGLSALPAHCFREMGFQSNRRVSQELFLRSPEAREPFLVPLLEGRNVGEFQEREPRLFLHPDEALLKDTRCRLRPRQDYARVDFVVRQTAAYTIAALHGELAFRNSLLGGFRTEELSAALLVGLLNSALFRALHLASQRDARQAAFPQVKLQHLRRLPAPPALPEERRRLEAVSTAISSRHSRDRAELDAAAFELFGIPAGPAEEVRRFLAERAPAACRELPE